MIREGKWFGQNGFDCRLEWGGRGAQAAAVRGDILIVVDVLCFSTAVATAAEHGAIIYPCGRSDDAEALSKERQASLAVRREQVPTGGRYSLSPQTFLTADVGERIVLPSPNGATCSRYGANVPSLLIGALVNAHAVADAAARVAVASGASITVLAGGERWLSASEDGDLRFAVEDYLGAGAILAHLPRSITRSPEAQVCESAFAGSAGRLGEILENCGSGIELRERGHGEDVELAARLNVYGSVPVMHEGAYLARDTGN